MLDQNNRESLKRMKLWLWLLGIACCFLFLVVLSGYLRAVVEEEQITKEKLRPLVSEAKTTADHEELAEYFRGQASQAEEMIKYHEDMMNMYVLQKRFPQSVEWMRNHCQKLIDTYQELQIQNEQMAKKHEQLAKELSEQETIPPLISLETKRNFPSYVKSAKVLTIIKNPSEIPQGESMVFGTNQKIIDSDTELFLKVKKGDDQAFKKLYQKYFERTLNLIFRFIPNQQHAEDIAQDVFLRVYSGAKSFSPRAKFSTWLHRITVNRCFSYHRKLKREKENYSSESDLHSSNETANPGIIKNHPSAVSTPNGHVLQNELNQAIQAALNKLSPDQKMAFILSQYEGLSYKEVALVSGNSEKAVERQIYHARQKLKKLLTPYVFS